MTTTTATHRVFPREYAQAGLSATAVAEQRREVTLRRISDLKSSLATIVSSSSSSPSSTYAPPSRDRYYSIEPRRTVASRESPEVVRPTATSPQLQPAALSVLRYGGPTPQGFLLGAQRQVERLTQENHDLVQRCLEWERRLLEGGGGGREQVHAVAVGLEDSGAVTSPKELPFFARDGRVASTGAAVEEAADRSPGSAAASGELPDAIYGLLHRLSVCYPELFDGLTPTNGATAGDSPSDHHDAGPAVAQLSEHGVCEALWRLENVVPGLVSSSRLGDLFTDTGAELLDRINTLEDEKQTDYFRVLDITGKLVTANADLTARQAGRQEEIAALRAELAEGRRQRGQLVDQLAAERVARVTAAEDLSHAADAADEAQRTAVAAAVAALEERLLLLAAEHAAETALLRRQLVTKAARAEAALAARDAEHAGQLRRLEAQLADKKAEIDDQARAIAAAMASVEALAAERDTAAAAQTEAKDALIRELQKQRAATSDEAAAAQDALGNAMEQIETLKAQLRERSAPPVAAVVTDDSDQLREQVRRLTEDRDALATRLTETSALTGGPDEEEEGEEPGSGGTDSSMNDPSSPVSPAELRKVKQSLRRVTHERTGLRRKLDRSGAALSEAEGRLAASDVRVRELEAQMAAGQMAADREQRQHLEQREQHSAPKTTPEATLELLDFFALDGGAPAAAAALAYPEPLAALSAPWLTSLAAGSLEDRIAAMDEDGRLEVQAGGRLYHVTMAAAEHAGLLSTERHGNHQAWGRLALQVQHAVEGRESAVFSGAYAAECARLYYGMLCASGLLGASSDAALAWALVVAGLCQFVGAPPLSTIMTGGVDTAPSGEQRWTAVEGILAHVAAANEAGPSAGSFYAPFAGDCDAEAAALAALRSLLSYEDGPLDGLFGCRLHRLTLLCCSLKRPLGEHGDEDNDNDEDEDEDAVAIAQLLLRLSREAVFLRGSPPWPPAAGCHLALFGRGSLCATTAATDPSDADADLATLADALLLYADGTVLPIALAATRLLNGEGSALIDRLEHTRGVLRVGGGGGAKSLSCDAVAALRGGFASGAAEAELELLQLYGANSAYRKHIESLLNTIESK